MSYYQYVTSIYVCTFCIYISFSVSYGSYTSGISTEICKQFAVTFYIQLKNPSNCAQNFTHLWPTKVFHLSFRSSTMSPSIISRCPSSACQNKIKFLFNLTTQLRFLNRKYLNVHEDSGF